jgi:hypothetical protein
MQQRGDGIDQPNQLAIWEEVEPSHRRYMFAPFDTESYDRRRHPRREVHLPAKLNFGRNLLQRPCIVRDISEGGARLYVGLLIGLPDRFALLMSRGGIMKRDCHLVWCSEFEAGIRFLG